TLLKNVSFILSGDRYVETIEKSPEYVEVLFDIQLFSLNSRIANQDCCLMILSLIVNLTEDLSCLPPHLSPITNQVFS
ncbi:MAG: hypothetical protein O4753_06185, partial [Trichodesmium sp. St7_bin2_1]|nr:hypothetical protein [Trichodesmium sp. St7_bin2_1]